MIITEHELRTAQRRRFLRALIEQLDTEPFQPHYRRKPVGSEVVGLPARLKSYFWPDKETDYGKTQSLHEPRWQKAKTLALALQTNDGWSSQEKKDALDLALDIFDWGRVPQGDATAEMVEAVFRSALSNQKYGDAPMNSGWTKVAAFATAHLEDSDDGFPHAIWDSRVSTSITSRLDKILVAARIEEPKSIFPRIGVVDGRGGTRPRELSLSWSYAYGFWSSHFAGSVLVKEIRDLLNTGGYPPMPLPDGGEGLWTIHGVGSILFMDGY